MTETLNARQRQLVLSVMDLCWFEAQKWTRKRLHTTGGPLFRQVLHEMAAGAWAGACEAARRFDPALGYKFSTYATFWIINGLQAASTEQAVLGTKWSHRNGFAKNPDIAVESFRRGEFDFAEILGDDEPAAGWGGEEWLAVRRHLNDDRSYWIVLQRYIAGLTMQEVAAGLRVSKEQVRQLEDKALPKLERCPLLRLMAGVDDARP